MTNHTNLIARPATILAALVAVSGGLLIAVPAHASYGAPDVNSGWNEVCTSRFDSNCIEKETAYNYATQIYPQYNTYNQYPSNSYNRYNTQNNNYYAPVSYYTPPVSYNYSSYPSQYNSSAYNYSYQYSYVTPTPSYSYVAPEYDNYSDNDSYNDYDNNYSNTNCDSYSYDDSCSYSY